MGAWIEMHQSQHLKLVQYRRTPRWVRGLKLFSFIEFLTCFWRRTPRWVRGLKSIGEGYKKGLESRTPRWVRGLKYLCQTRYMNYEQGRTPRWVRGLKLYIFLQWNQQYLSHPTMGAWIEIWKELSVSKTCRVAPHDGCVDWNYFL